MKKITLKSAISGLRRAVKEKGKDYVYPSPEIGKCLYFDPASGEPSCIVGHVISYHGYTLQDLELYASMYGNSCPVWQLPFLANRDVTQVLYQAQQVQDHGGRWELALNAALREAEAIKN